MKKVFLSLVATLIAASSFAQMPGGGEFKPEDMANRRVEQIKEDLKDNKMNEEQSKKVYALFLKQTQDQMKKMQEAMEKGEMPSFDMEAMRKQQDALNAQLKQILTAEQYAAYDKGQKDRMARFSQGGFGGGMPGGPAPR